jgi:hypothetical protein
VIRRRLAARAAGALPAVVARIVMSLACFLGVGLVVLALLRAGAAKAQYVESFALDDGERVLWLDASSDAYPVLTSRAVFPSFRRLHRGAVLVTNRRIVVGAKVLFGERHLIRHVLYPADRPFPEDANRVGGGSWARGYATLVFDRAAVETMRAGDRSFIDLRLSTAAASSTNIDWFRIYSASAETFRLPE